MPDPALAPAGSKVAAKAGLGAWAHAHHGLAMGGAAVAGVGALALMRARSKAAAAAAASPNSTGQTIIPMSTPNSSGQEVLASLQPEIDALAAQLQNIPTVGPAAPTPSTTWGDPTSLASSLAAAQAQAQQAVAGGAYGDTSTPGGLFLALTAANRALGLPYTVSQGGVASVVNPGVPGQSLGAGQFNAYASNPYLYQGLQLGRPAAWQAAISGNIPPTPAPAAA